VETKPEQQHDLLTVDDLVRYLRLGRTRTNELLRSGEISSYKIGRRRLIHRRDVEAWLEQNKFRPGE
jgi:excisionase family DNA binding protein